MPKASTKHPKVQNTFKFSYGGGYAQDKEDQNLSIDQLTECMNFKFALDKDGVVLNVRQGSTKISNSALPAAADVLACTYYIADSKYILATAAKLYELDGSSDPVEIGTLDGIPTFTEFNSKLIIHDSGITKSWDGTTFKKITRLFQDEVLGTGDDIEAQFTGNLSNLTVVVSSITITFTGTAVTKTITDNGSGALTGDVDGGGTNTINYTTGAYDFTCSEPPDCDTTVTVDYQEVDGAAKSKAGLIRGSRLYTWGDADNVSRLTYSEVNDESGTDTSSGGGYLDVDPNDGGSLLGCLNFYTTILCLKDNETMHRIDDYPGDPSFSVEPLTDDLGTVSHRTVLFEGGIISFMAKEGWVAMSSSQRFGDIQKGVPLSSNFKKNAVRYANSTAYTAFNPIDNQLWLALSTDGGATYLNYIYVQNLDVPGLVSLYRFAFAHTCFFYANGEMLIGGADGILYKLDDTNTVWKDNAVAYSTNTYIKSASTDWQLPNNDKHNKRVQIRGKVGSFTGNFKLYKNGSASAFSTSAVVAAVGILTRDVLKFRYKHIQYELSAIVATDLTDIKGVDFTSAILGD